MYGWLAVKVVMCLMFAALTVPCVVAGKCLCSIQRACSGEADVARPMLQVPAKYLYVCVWLLQVLCSAITVFAQCVSTAEHRHLLGLPD